MYPYWLEDRDGKKNPEKIPDSLAYFLYFTHVGHALDNEAKDPIKVKLLLEGTGLGEVDRSVLRQVIIKHQREQRTFVNKINAEVATGTATQESIVAFRNAKTKCTMDAVDSLLTQLSPGGAVTFRKFIQGWKSHITTDEGAV